jgi:hypothetical protein
MNALTHSSHTAHTKSRLIDRVSPVTFYATELPDMPSPRRSHGWVSGGRNPLRDDSHAGSFRVNLDSRAGGPLHPRSAMTLTSSARWLTDHFAHPLQSRGNGMTALATIDIRIRSPGRRRCHLMRLPIYF